MLCQRSRRDATWRAAYRSRGSPHEDRNAGGRLLHIPADVHDIAAHLDDLARVAERHALRPPEPRRHIPGPTARQRAHTNDAAMAEPEPRREWPPDGVNLAKSVIELILAEFGPTLVDVGRVRARFCHPSAPRRRSGWLLPRLMRLAAPSISRDHPTWWSTPIRWSRRANLVSWERLSPPRPPAAPGLAANTHDAMEVQEAAP